MKSALALTTIMAIGSISAFGKDQVSVNQKDMPGLRTTTFATPKGSITVYTPESRGTFTGAVVAEPAGKTDHERRENASQLEGYVIEANGQRASVGSRVIRYIVPGATAAAEFMILKDRSGKPLTTPSGAPLWRANPNGPEPYRIFGQPGTGPELPIRKKEERTTPSGPTGWRDNPNGPEPYRLFFYRPAVAQAGEPLEIPGNFDGDFSNTRVDVGSQTAQPLLETENMLVVRVPENTLGRSTLMLREGDSVESWAFRSVAVSLSAPVTTLRPGQDTELLVSVSGLEELEQPLDMQLTNGKPAAIRLAGGDQQVVRIDPLEVHAPGTFTTVRSIVGISPGPFTITAEIQDRAR